MWKNIFVNVILTDQYDVFLVGPNVVYEGLAVTFWRLDVLAPKCFGAKTL